MAAAPSLGPPLPCAPLELQGIAPWESLLFERVTHALPPLPPPVTAPPDPSLVLDAASEGRRDPLPQNDRSIMVSHGLRRFRAPAWIALVLSLATASSCTSPEVHGEPWDRGVEADSPRTLLIVLDGLRPDYVTPEMMPRLAELRSQGSWGREHHAVFPTLTRVNAPSMATGVRPGIHGLMENSIFVPELDGGVTISTGDAGELRRAESALGGPLLSSPDLAQILHPLGKRLMVASSGSSGSAYLLNHSTPSGPVVNTELVLPDSLEGEVEARLGPPPPPARPNLARNRRAVDAFFAWGVGESEADVVLMWLSDPDNTAHSDGVGTPVTLDAIRAVDAEVGRIVDSLAVAGLLDGTDLIITSDHGFSTHIGTVRTDRFLVERGLKASLDSRDVVVAGGGIHVLEGGEARVLAIAEALRTEPWVGALFSRGATPDALDGWVPGTLSYASIRYDHPRAPDLYLSANWSDAPNELGWPGTTWQLGTAGHGTSSPWDIRATLLAVGPSFREGVEFAIPTGHHDLAPTILHLQGVPVPGAMEGRVLHELLRSSEGGPLPSVQRGSHSVRAPLPGGEYVTTLHHAEVQGSYYVKHTVTERP